MSEKGFKSLELCSQEYKLCMRKSEDLMCKDYFGGILSQNDMKSLGDATWMSEKGLESLGRHVQVHKL